ncbi:MAG: hypothetical protein AAFY73_15225 [Pseudomonadota bacterium]
MSATPDIKRNQIGIQIMSNEGTLFVAANTATLQVTTNAGDTQKVLITGPGDFHAELAGTGEGNVLTKQTVGHGEYAVKGYSVKGGKLIPSQVRAYGTRRLGFNDTGGDADFNDAIVEIL